jgi:hypothetical protein
MNIKKFKMKNIRIVSLILGVVTIMFVMTRCQLAGLDLQEKYDYDAQAGIISNELNKTVLEFLNSRPDAFSLMLEGLNYAELSDRYNEPNSTYIVLTNAALNSYFLSHPRRNPLFNPNDPSTGLPFTVPISLTQFPKEEVQEFLLYHIVKGAYTWSNLPPVQTWYDTYASADTAKVNLYLMKNDRSPTIGFNDFPSHYLAAIRARTTNLKSSSGSYVHVLDNWLNYPTRAALEGN